MKGLRGKVHCRSSSSRAPGSQAAPAARCASAETRESSRERARRERSRRDGRESPGASGRDRDGERRRFLRPAAGPRTSAISRHTFIGYTVAYTAARAASLAPRRANVFCTCVCVSHVTSLLTLSTHDAPPLSSVLTHGTARDTLERHPTTQRTTELQTQHQQRTNKL